MGEGLDMKCKLLSEYKKTLIGTKDMQQLESSCKLTGQTLIGDELKNLQYFNEIELLRIMQLLKSTPYKFPYTFKPEIYKFFIWSKLNRSWKSIII